LLTPDRKILRRPAGNETAPAEAEAAKDVAPGADKTQPLHAGRVKRSRAGARLYPLHLRLAFWARLVAAA